MSEHPTCGTCRFWVSDGSRDWGYCHEGPPQAIPDHPTGQWPLTSHDQWCGHHKLKPKEKPSGD